jgi:U6 snRNA-associated Sm-like protein LSm3
MTDFANAVEEPIDLLLLSLKEKVYVKCRHGRELKGKLNVKCNALLIFIGL